MRKVPRHQRLGVRGPAYHQKETSRGVFSAYKKEPYDLVRRAAGPRKQERESKTPNGKMGVGNHHPETPEKRGGNIHPE